MLQQINDFMVKTTRYHDIKTCSTHNKGKSVDAEIFIRNLKNKIEKYMALILKNVCIDKIEDMIDFDKQNNTHHKTIKMKPIDVKPITYVNFEVENNEKDLKFKVGDNLKISKYKKVFARAYTPNWSEEVFIIKKVRNTVPQAHIISELYGKEIVGTFCEKELQKTNQT